MNKITKFALFGLWLIVLGLFALGVAHVTKTLVVREISPMLAGREMVDQIQDYCQNLTGSRVFAIQFPTATSTVGAIGCTNQ